MKKSVIAKGKRARAVVFLGKREKTVSGLKRADLIKNKYGRIVSKKASASSKRRYSKTGKAWADSVKAARKELRVQGFVPIGGKTAAGKALHAKAKAIYKSK